MTDTHDTSRFGVHENTDAAHETKDGSVTLDPGSVLLGLADSVPRDLTVTGPGTLGAQTLLLWFDNEKPSGGRGRWAWECHLQHGRAVLAEARDPDLHKVMAEVLRQSASTPSTLGALAGCPSGGNTETVTETLLALAAALPRDPVVWDDGHGDTEHWPEVSIWFAREHLGDQWFWDVEFLALDSTSNAFERGTDLRRVLRRVLDRIEGTPR